jgi:predicted SprT family Zn-dependent metalloprotease
MKHLEKIKLKRLNIDELAECYEVIDDILKQSIKGGTYYFSTEGSFLGNAGYGNDVRIVTAEQWDVAYCYQLGGQGVSFTECSDTQTLTNIIASFLPPGSYSSITTYGGAMAGYNVNTNQFLFNQNDPMMNNYFNLLSTMEHELYHYNNGQIVSGLTSTQEAQNEYNNILSQVNSSTYALTTQAYKDRTARYLYDQWCTLHINGQVGHTLYDAKSICDAL